MLLQSVVSSRLVLLFVLLFLHLQSRMMNQLWSSSVLILSVSVQILFPVQLFQIDNLALEKSDGSKAVHGDRSSLTIDFYSRQLIIDTFHLAERWSECCKWNRSSSIEKKNISLKIFRCFKSNLGSVVDNGAFLSLNSNC